MESPGAHAYELKWDGFRAIVSTEGSLRVRSRRGWDMTEHVGFLAELPVHAVLDGEFVARRWPTGLPADLRAQRSGVRPGKRTAASAAT
jgi:ATP-dependent DNA ligase